jgi:ketosteroid isomerase-like protein
MAGKKPTVERNLDLVRRLHKAMADRDEDAFASFYAEKAVQRVAGVPRELGGVVEGRDAIAENLRRHDLEWFDIRQLIGDEGNVCLIARLSGIAAGSSAFKGNMRPYTTYTCIVFRIEDDKIVEETHYANWMSVYVQTGMMDVKKLLRK